MSWIVEALLLGLTACIVLGQSATQPYPQIRMAEGSESSEAAARRHVERATAALRAHDLARGESELRLALQADPNLAEAYFMLAGLELRHGKAPESVADYKRGLKLDPGSFEGHYDLALAYLGQGRQDEGLRELQRAAMLNPKSADAAYNLGLLLLGMGKSEDAIRHLREAEAAEPGRPDVAFNLLRALLASGRRKEAREQAARDSKFLAGDPKWNASVGTLFAESHDPEEAVAYLEAAVELDPNSIATREQLGAAELVANRPRDTLEALADAGSSQSHYLRASAFLELHRLTLADHEATLARDEQPANPRYLLLAARIAQHRDDPRRAIELIDKAIEVAPNFSELYYNVAVSYYFERRYGDALRSLDQAIRLDPRSARALFLDGVIAVNEGDNRKAENCLSRAISIEPANARFHFHLGFAYLRDNRVREAQQAFEKAIQLRPDYALPHYELGKLLSRQGEQERAENELLETIQYQPNLAQAYYQLARLYAKTGQAEKASQAVGTFNKLKKKMNDEDLLRLEDASLALQ